MPRTRDRNQQGGTSLEDRLAVSEEGSNGSPLHNLVLHHFHHLHLLLQCHLWSNPLHHLRRGTSTPPSLSRLSCVRSRPTYQRATISTLLLKRSSHHLVQQWLIMNFYATMLMQRSSQHLVRRWLIVEKFLLSLQQPLCLSTTTCRQRHCSRHAASRPEGGLTQGI